MRLSSEINSSLHKFLLRYLRRQYVKKIAITRKKHPDVFRAAPKPVQEEHIALWKPLIGIVNTDWLDMFYGVSGLADARFVPEDVFYGVIERCLNNCNASGTQLEDKSNSCFYMPESMQPNVVIRYVRGVWFDGEMRPVSKDVASEILSKSAVDVVGKPTMGSCGGSNVMCFKKRGNGYFHDGFALSLDRIEADFEAYVVQERLRQEPVVAAFNPDSLNTCRIVTFRRPWSGKTTVIAGMLRLGCGHEIVDNLAAGGVSADIGSGGVIADFAVDHDFGKVTRHPVSKLPFKDFHIPYYLEMCDACCRVAERIPDFNLLSFDVIARRDGSPCIIEVNTTSMTLAQLQTQRPLFGEETRQLIGWCAEHMQFDKFAHFRTWY